MLDGAADWELLSKRIEAVACEVVSLDRKGGVPSDLAPVAVG